MVLRNVKLERETSDDETKLRIPHQDVLDDWSGDRRFDSIGADQDSAPSRLEGFEKVTGSARYTSDVRLPGQLYGAVLRSPHPHARVVSVDISRAEALTGVCAVLSGNDELGIDWYSEEVPLFPPTVRFVGDEVAAVAALSEEVAHDALELIEVQYEPLPVTPHLAAALRDDAARLHGASAQAGETDTYERGDVAEARRHADVTVQRTYTTQTALHNSLEPHGTTACWGDRELVVYESTQGVFEVRQLLAEKLGRPLNEVRVVCEHMGGGFGSKQTLWKQTVIASLLSKKSGRPVQLMLDREEECLATGNRNPTHQEVKLSARRDGTLTGIELDACAAVGAYRTSGEGSAIASMYQHLYRCANVRTSQRFLYTNTGPAVAFRAPGYVEACFALESAMDELARELDIDPLELRRLNYTREDQTNERPWSSPEGLEACYQRLDETFGWSSSEKREGESPNDDRSARLRRGRGLAAHEWVAGMGSPPAYALITLNQDGTVELITGTQDIGTGTRTVLAQIAAEVLGLDVTQVTVRLGDTASGLEAPVSQGSFTVPTLTPAVRQAAENLKTQLFDAAVELAGDDLHTADLELDGGSIRRVSDSQDSEADVLFTVQEVAEALDPHRLQGHGSRHENPDGTTIRPFGAMAAEVRVDTSTGEITVLRIVDAPDCGRIVNRKLANSQVLGGVTQGVGFALTEERVVDEDLGLVLNADLEDYKIATSLDIPQIEHAEVDLPDLQANALGVKGLGELPLIPVAAAVANAVFDATGVRIRELPITPARFLEAQRRQSAKAGDGNDQPPEGASATGSASP